MCVLVAQSFWTFGHPLDCSITQSVGQRSPKQTTTMHWPGIKPGSPAWEERILPLNHQCHYRENVCKDDLDGDLLKSFSSASHSCPVLVGWSRLSSSALRSTGCPLPSGLLRVALAGTQVCDGSVWAVEPPGARAHWLSLVPLFATPCPPGSSVPGIATPLC